MKNRTYVLYSDIEEAIKKYDLNYIICYGGRNDGKSYAAKEKVLRDFFETGAEFCYLRRYDSDIKRDADNTLYWEDFMKGSPNKIQELSRKAWDGIKAEKGRFFLYTIDENGKQHSGAAVGYIHALSMSEKRYKSLQFPDVQTVIYEEFCTAGDYLYHESRLFSNYISTIARDRRINVIMVGNTISKHNIYFREWEMVNVPKQKPGTIDVYSYADESGNIIRVGAFYTHAIKENKMFFGQSAKMITGGEWDSIEQPKLEKDECEYNEAYRFILEIDANNRFLCRFMYRDQIGVWYVTPKTTPAKAGERLISPDPVESPFYTSGLIPINATEQRLFPYFRMGRIAYSDNLTGTEFKRGIAQLSDLTGYHKE